MEIDLDNSDLVQVPMQKKPPPTPGMSDFLNAKTNLGAGTLNVDGIDSKMQEIHDEFSDEDNE